MSNNTLTQDDKMLIAKLKNSNIKELAIEYNKTERAITFKILNAASIMYEHYKIPMQILEKEFNISQEALMCY